MLEALIQATAIANYGNLVISTRDTGGAADLLKSLEIFAGIDSWDFERCSSKGRPVSLASLPSLWFRRLLSEDVYELKLSLGKYTQADIGKWPNPTHPQIGVSCEGNAGIEVWRPEWKVTGYRNGAPTIKCIWSAERSGRQFSSQRADPADGLAKWESAIVALTDLLSAREPVWKNRLGLLMTLHRQRDLDMGRFAQALPPQFGIPVAKLCYANAIRTYLMLSSTDFTSLRSTLASESQFAKFEGDVLQSVANLLECGSSAVSAQNLKRAA